MKKKVYILGAGPAGMAAAHAAATKGYEVEIASNSISPSVISGAQYLDKPISGINWEPDGSVTFYKRGTAEGYANKIYGDPKAPSSWDKYEHQGRYPLWYLRDAYSKLWEMYSPKVFMLNVNADVMNQFVSTDAALIVVAMPLGALCFNPEHNFKSQNVTIYHGIPNDIGKKYEHLKKKDSGNWIMYSGKNRDVWYRCSSINQGASTEVSGHQEGEGRVRIFKPISSNCDCWKSVDRVVLVGRYGTWEKNELVSGAWEKVYNALQ